jgi:hypothetical protein
MEMWSYSRDGTELGSFLLTDGGYFPVFMSVIDMPGLIFMDGFESGGTTVWSASVGD